MNGSEPDPLAAERPESSASARLADLRQRVAADEQLAAQIEQRTRERLGGFERTQGLIGTSIIGLFVVQLVVLTAAYLLAPFVPAADRITAGADRARELANTLLLPIVTLVPGYYFGKQAG